MQSGGSEIFALQLLTGNLTLGFDSETRGFVHKVEDQKKINLGSLAKPAIGACQRATK